MSVKILTEICGSDNIIIEYEKDGKKNTTIFPRAIFDLQKARENVLAMQRKDEKKSQNTNKNEPQKENKGIE